MSATLKEFRGIWDDSPGNNVLEHYAKLVDKYEVAHGNTYYFGPRFVSDELASLTPTALRSDVQIIDIASGTGLVGKELVNVGFQIIDGVEPVEAMLKESQKLRIYRRIIQDVVGDYPLDIAERTYDFVVTSGSFIAGHLPLTALDEMVRICKADGYIVICMRHEFLTIYKELRGMEPYIKNLEDSGLVRLISKKIKPKYFYNHDGVTFVLQRKLA